MLLTCVSFSVSIEGAIGKTIARTSNKRSEGCAPALFVLTGSGYSSACLSVSPSVCLTLRLLSSCPQEEGEETPSGDGGDDTAGVAADEAKLSEIYGRLGQIGAASAEARAAVILSGLGFSTEVQVREATIHM